MAAGLGDAHLPNRLVDTGSDEPAFECRLLADTTEHPTVESKAYLRTVKDVGPRPKAG